jgi:hypothetical protein
MVSPQVAEPQQCLAHKLVVAAPEAGAQRPLGQSSLLSQVAATACDPGGAQVQLSWGASADTSLSRQI